jgi:hypothetical protein
MLLGEIVSGGPVGVGDAVADGLADGLGDAMPGIGSS